MILIGRDSTLAGAASVKVMCAQGEQDDQQTLTTPFLFLKMPPHPSALDAVVRLSSAGYFASVLGS